MGVWVDEIEPDMAILAGEDGETVTITTATVTRSVRVFWEGLSLMDGGQTQEGQQCWAASTALPADIAQGDTVTYDGTTYTVTHVEPDGHNTSRIMLHEVL